MGSVGAPELLVILLVALIVLGPDRLPKVARQMGRAMSEFKRVTSGFEDEMRKAMNDVTDGSGASGPGSPATPAEPGTATSRGAAAGDSVPPPADRPPVPSARPVVPPDELPPPPDDPSRN